MLSDYAYFLFIAHMVPTRCIYSCHQVAETIYGSRALQKLLTLDCLCIFKEEECTNEGKVGVVLDISELIMEQRQLSHIADAG